MENIKTLSFSYNWNNKLHCKAFTTIRLKSNKFIVGENYKIIQKTPKDSLINHGLAKLVSIKQFTLDEINEYMARIDTGYSLEECRKIILTMYKNKNIDWKTQLLVMPLLVKLPSND